MRHRRDEVRLRPVDGPQLPDEAVLLLIQAGMTQAPPQVGRYRLHRVDLGRRPRMTGPQPLGRDEPQHLGAHPERRDQMRHHASLAPRVTYLWFELVAFRAADILRPRAGLGPEQVVQRRDPARGEIVQETVRKQPVMIMILALRRPSAPSRRTYRDK